MPSPNPPDPKLESLYPTGDNVSNITLCVWQAICVCLRKGEPLESVLNHG